MKAWPFVSREKEARYIRRELEAGRSVVLTGIWGSGRTALARHLAGQMTREWLFVFVDFERGIAHAWRTLFGAIWPRAEARLGGRTRPVAWLRYRVLHQALENPGRPVIVLDNVGRPTPQRIEAVRRLRQRFPVVAIVEAFVPEPERRQLSAALWARPALELGPLSLSATTALLEECSARYDLGWGPGEIRGMARAVAGFPLGIRQAVARELRRRDGGGARRRASVSRVR